MLPTIREGSVRKTAKRSRPAYRLTRVGFLDLVTSITRDPIFPFEHFLFFHHFIETYRWRIEELVGEEGTQFPKALKLELDAVLDPKRFLQKQFDRIKQEVELLKGRVFEAQQTVQIAKAALMQGRSLPEMVAQIEKLYPYELNNQKPLSDLMGELPERIQKWELIEGNQKRVNLLWEPRLKILETHLNVLESLK